MSRIVHLPPVSKDKANVPPPVNRCIYCGDGNVEVLTREHVLPAGLGGGIVLNKASCPVCQKIIHKVETATMRGMLLDYRREFDLIRHRDELPPTTVLRIGGEDRVVPIADAPSFLTVPKLSTWPGILRGLEPRSEFKWERVVLANAEAFRECAAKFGGQVSAERLIDLDSYFRMIAKIAHGWAVAHRGLGTFRPLLPDFILGKHPELLPYLIGDTPWEKTEPYEGRLSHMLLLTNLEWKGRSYLLARVWLFAAHNAPAYTVVVGDLEKNIFTPSTSV